MTELFDLTGRVALVTGARSGIGQAIAVGYAKAGADLVLLGHQDNMGETAAAVGEAGRKAEVALLDLSDPSAVGPFCAELLADHQVDIVVNNAGTIRRGPVEDIPLEGWHEVLQTNLDSAFALAQACGRPMLERGSGKIINIASMLSFQGGINVAAYTVSKHGIVGLTKALANEWAGRGVQVNAIAPGYIATNNTAALVADPVREPAIRARIPAGRWGTPEDLVGAAVFLASRASDYVTGHVLAVDGGWLGR
jgi:2-deoxy-D-gluconate 3-dehydrogenase